MDAAAVLKERFELREITPEKYRTMGSLMMRYDLEQYAVDHHEHAAGGIPEGKRLRAPSLQKRLQERHQQG